MHPSSSSERTRSLHVRNSLDPSWITVCNDIRLINSL